MTGYDKIALARSRALIGSKMGGTAESCERCQWLARCRSLAPQRPVLCELSDTDAQVKPDHAWTKSTEGVHGAEASEWYYQVHLFPIKRSAANE